jgi:hypothetical protein
MLMMVGTQETANACSIFEWAIVPHLRNFEQLGFLANGLSWNGIAAGFNLTVKDVPSMYNDNEVQHIHLFPHE